MSVYVVNQSCDMCKQIEKPLCTMTVGNTKHPMCYTCMSKFVWDLAQFAELNLRNEMKELGGVIKTELIKED